MKIQHLDYLFLLKQCALGINQLKNLKKFLKKRKEISNFYNKNLSNYSDFYFIKHKREYHSSHHLYFIKFKNFNLKKKNKFIRFMKSKKIYLQYHYIPIYKFKVFKDKFIGKILKSFLMIH